MSFSVNKLCDWSLGTSPNSYIFHHLIHLLIICFHISNSFPFLVAICEADSATKFDCDTNTISYEDQSTKNDRESNYYSHSEPEFVEDSNSESDSESQNSENDAMVN